MVSRLRSNGKDTIKLEKPNWIKVKSTGIGDFNEVRDNLKAKNLHTVCEEAACPNIGECWRKKHATVMILGDICTRACAFCNVKTGKPVELDMNEPEKVGELAAVMGLNHIVITSVDRDDLDDGGADHFVKVIKKVRELSPKTTIEVLTPDFKGKKGALEKVVEASPDVFNHNLETVARLHKLIKPKANYFYSLNLLWRVKELNPSIFTKSGLIVGLGEDNKEVIQAMDDMRNAEVDFLTIGQYLAPTPYHIAVDRYVILEDFNMFKEKALRKGFLLVSSSPLTRSSYHADSDFLKLKENFKKQNG